MSDDESVDEYHIYVFPSQEGLPPRAVLFTGELEEGGQLREENHPHYTLWSRDMGLWIDVESSFPLPTPLSDTITEHAKSLGVKW